MVWCVPLGADRCIGFVAINGRAVSKFCLNLLSASFIVILLMRCAVRTRSTALARARFAQGERRIKACFCVVLETFCE